MFIKAKLFLPFLLVVFAVVAGVGLFAQQIEAITTKILKSQIQSVRYRVTAADVVAAANLDPTGALREITLFTLAGGDQILSWVSNVTTPFSMSSDPLNPVGLIGIRARQNGVDISSCDIAMPPNLTFVNFEHRLGSCLEYAFYDEILPTDIVVTFLAGGGGSLDRVDAGQVDFIVSKIQ